MTIYEAFTSGKEVRRRSGATIKDILLCSWKPEPNLLTVDEHSRVFWVYQDGSFDGPNKEPHEWDVLGPDPRDEAVNRNDMQYFEWNLFPICLLVAGVILALCGVHGWGWLIFLSAGFAVFPKIENDKK